MDLTEWLRQRDGIAHRRDVLEAGYSISVLRAFMRRADVRVVRRQWIATPAAAPDVVRALMAGGRVACVSLARRRGWWMPPGADLRLHVQLDPHAASAAARTGDTDLVRHWNRPLAPVSPRAFETSPEDALAHIAWCLPREPALVLWESAVRVERLAVDALRSIRWPHRAAAECAAAITGLSDSGLETLVVLPLRRWGVPLRQQVVIAGRRVDLLVGERLVVQIDGFRFHASPGQRAADIAHDAELRLRGYTVVRVSYAQVVHEWATVERMLQRALAAGLHLAPWREHRRSTNVG